MTGKLVQGVYAAVLTPRRPDDSVEETAFIRLIEFLVDRNIAGFAVNGATGEFCLTRPRHLRTLFSVLHKYAGDSATLCGVGAAGEAGTIELARIAAGEGAQALVLSMPFFFPYQQEDLEEFVHTVATSVTLPILLYNLPEFTSALEPETACRLIRDVPNVIGIKDSSGSLDILRQLTEQKIHACRIVGHDGVLASALRERVCDGVVSGVACVLPELIRSIFDEGSNAGSAKFEQLCVLLDVVTDQLSQLPTPWGLKWIAEARGILKATFSQPVSQRRKQQGLDVIAWYQQLQSNLPQIGVPCER